MKFARIVNHSAVDVRDESPEGCFTPNLVAEFVSVPDQVENGWFLKNGVWSAPVVPEPVPGLVIPLPAVYQKVSPVEFKLLFTSAERVAIRGARKTDLILDDFFDIIEDPRLTCVDLGLQSTQEALGYMAQKGWLAAERVPVILAGVIQ